MVPPRTCPPKGEVEQAEEEEKTEVNRGEEVWLPSTNAKAVPPDERWMPFSKEKELAGYFQERKKK